MKPISEPVASIVAGAAGQAVTGLDVAAAGTDVAAGLIYEDGVGGHVVAYAVHNGTGWGAPVWVWSWVWA